MKIGDKVRFTNPGSYSAPTGSTARIVRIESPYIQVEWIDKGDSSQMDGNYSPKDFEVIKEELEILPRKWCVEATKENWKILFEWAKFTWDWNERNKYITSNKSHMDSLEEGNYTEISFETFEKLVLNKTTKTKPIMSKQKLTVGITDVLEIHKIACPTWKETIAKYLTRVDSDQNITFTQEEVDEMFKAATSSQLPKLEDIFGAQHKELTLEDIANGKLLFRGRYVDGNIAGMIEVRSFYEYKNKAFWLHDYYNWEIKKDSKGKLVLIPTLKTNE